MKPRVFLTRRIPEEGIRRLQDKFELKIWPEEGPPPRNVLFKEIKDIDALITTVSDKIDGELISSARVLKVIAQYAVGIDNIDIEAATRQGVYVTNTPGVLTETTADTAWALLMAVSRRIVEADNYIRDGKWKAGWAPLMFLGRDVYGKTLGIVGLGRIGTSIARRAIGFNMKVLYYDIVRRIDIETELGIEFADFNRILEESDFVTIHAPLTEETRKLFGEREFKTMKRTAYLVNAARGTIVDESALTKALQEGWIAGAALDVFEEEPISPENPLLKLGNVILVPHIGSASVETRAKMAIMVVENLLRFFKGETPPNLVNPEVLNFRNPQKLL